MRGLRVVRMAVWEWGGESGEGCAASWNGGEAMKERIPIVYQKNRWIQVGKGAWTVETTDVRNAEAKQECALNQS